MKGGDKGKRGKGKRIEFHAGYRKEIVLGV